MRKNGIFCLTLVFVLALTVLNGAWVHGETPTITFVSAAGVISSYGPDQARGWISIFAAVDKWADGWGAFAVPPVGKYRILIYPPPPFNFTLYMTRIVNASVVKLDYNASDFWVSGFWGISSVANPSSFRDIARLIRNVTIAAGDLSITGNWTYFTINIKGYESIQGNITSYCIRKIEDIYGRYPYCDVNRDCKIDGKDIAAIARAFGSMLGFDRYELIADTNFDLTIDGKDIAQCALSFGKRY